MALLSLQDVSLGFGGPLLLEGANLQIEEGERICLLGRNGSGKSSLLRLIAGHLTPTGGSIRRESDLRVARLAQDVPTDAGKSIFEVVSEGLGEVGNLLKQYREISRELDDSGDIELLPKVQDLQHKLEACNGWNGHLQVDAVISRMKLDATASFESLSAGLKRRVMFARALACNPQLLLLDEPTNHLDIEAIRWLETFLSSFQGTMVFVTHDRAFLQALATRILDIDRGRLSSWSCEYKEYVRRKQALVEAESHQHSEFDRKLADEEAWFRRGVRERRTRNEGRVRALKDMRRIRSDRRDLAGRARLQAQEAELSGNLVIEAKNASFGFAGKPVIRSLTTTILRGDKVGIIGRNGSGKTTLLRLLLGELRTQSGNVRHGTNLQIVYSDQLHASLDENKSVLENVSDGNEMITINGRPRHVIGYLRDFLFPAEQTKCPVRLLSGGERNRLLLARMFTRPSNLIVLDEPTNDLDIETLDVIESLLMEYRGTVLLVSHDREFLNNVVTSTLAVEDDARVGAFAGGYDDWVQQQAQGTPADAQAEPRTAPRPPRNQASPPRRDRKLTNKQREALETLPRRIEQLELESSRLQEQMASPDYYRQGPEAITGASNRLKEIRIELDVLLEQWIELEALRESL